MNKLKHIEHTNACKEYLKIQIIIIYSKQNKIIKFSSLTLYFRNENNKHL